MGGRGTAVSSSFRGLSARSPKWQWLVRATEVWQGEGLWQGQGATGCTINTVACFRMSVSAARPVQRQATYPERFLDCRFCASRCPFNPSPLSEPTQHLRCNCGRHSRGSCCCLLVCWLVHFLCCNRVAQIMHKPMKHASDSCTLPAVARPLTALARLSANPNPLLCSTVQLFAQRFSTLCGYLRH